MNDGDTHKITYGFRSFTLGVKNFSTNVNSSLAIYNAYDEIQKVVHKPNTLTNKLLVVDDAGSSEHPAMKSILSWMGYSYDTATIQDLTDSDIPNTYRQVVILNNVEELSSEFNHPDFINHFKTYLNNGGNVALFGSSAEILDISGITSNLFTYSPTSSVWTLDLEYIENINHPITSEYTLGQYITTTTQMRFLRGSSYVIDESLGMVHFGYGKDSGTNGTFDNFGEMPYGSGKIVFLGHASFEYASNDFNSLVVRILDYLQDETNVSLKVDMSCPVPATQNEIFEIDVDVTAYGGALATDGISNTINIPDNITLDYVKLDGATIGTNLTVSLGSMNDGDTHKITYGFRSFTLGVKNFSTNVNSSLAIYNAYDEIQKVVHKPNTLTNKLLVVDDAGSSEHPAMKSILSWMGYSYDTATIQDLTDSDIPNTYRQVVILNNVEELSSEFNHPDFINHFKTYLNNGGNVALFGSSAEILDISGITSNLFTYSPTSSVWTLDLEYIENINHPITSEYTLGQYITTTTQMRFLRGSSYVIDESLGMVHFGYGKDSGTNGTFDNFGEMPYGSGKIVFLGHASFEYASNDFKSLIVRILDYLQNESSVSMKVEMLAPVPAVRNEVFEIDVDVTAYGGALSIEGVVNTLTIPTNTTLEYVEVDGITVTKNLSASLGTMSNSTTKRVTYGLSVTNLGVKDFSSSVTNTSNSYSAFDTTQKVIHRPDVLSKKILIVDNVTDEHSALKNSFSWMGYTYDCVTPQDVIDDGLSTTYKQVVIFNNASILPSTYNNTTFLSDIKTYMNDGGNVALFGNAAEILDMSGITTDLFSAFTDQIDRQYIRDINHSITEEYTLNSYFDPTTDDLTLNGSKFILDQGIGMVYLGNAQDYSTTAQYNFGELPYGGGKAVFLGNATFMTPSDNFKSLVVRIVDYLNDQIGVPENVTTSVADNNINLSWDVVTDAIGYKIYCSFEPYDNFTHVETIYTNTYQLPLTEQRLFFYVIATNTPITKEEPTVKFNEYLKSLKTEGNLAP